MFQSFATADLQVEDGKKILGALRSKGPKEFFLHKERGGDTGFIDFLENFWDWDKSPYIGERLLQGHGVHTQEPFHH